MRHLRRINHTKHILLILLAGFVGLVLILIIGNLYFEKFNPISSNIKFGVTFSPNNATYAGSDWKEAYLKILNELSVKNLRLSASWADLEPKRDKFDFSQTDFMIDEAQKTGAKVILVIGMKQPRWPECHLPAWIGGMDEQFKKQRLLIMLQEVINHYEDNPTITTWQLENEPLFPFGNCPLPDRLFLKDEVKLVKGLTKKPVLMTDTGEWRTWRTPMRMSDIFGFSLYRGAYHELLGYYYYPFPPALYHFKSDLARMLFARNNKRTIITELQAEPWVKDGFVKTPIEEQGQRFSLKNFQDNIAIAKRTGFDEIYLWGVEWWYLMAQKGHPEYLEYAKSLF